MCSTLKRNISEDIFDYFAEKMPLISNVTPYIFVVIALKVGFYTHLGEYDREYLSVILIIHCPDIPEYKLFESMRVTKF
jgi:hypothetical protein